MNENDIPPAYKSYTTLPEYHSADDEAILKEIEFPHDKQHFQIPEQHAEEGQARAPPSNTDQSSGPCCCEEQARQFRARLARFLGKYLILSLILSLVLLGVVLGVMAGLGLLPLPKHKFVTKTQLE